MFSVSNIDPSASDLLTVINPSIFIGWKTRMPAGVGTRQTTIPDGSNPFGAWLVQVQNAYAASQPCTSTCISSCSYNDVLLHNTTIVNCYSLFGLSRPFRFLVSLKPTVCFAQVLLIAPNVSALGCTISMFLSLCWLKFSDNTKEIYVKSEHTHEPIWRALGCYYVDLWFGFGCWGYSSMNW